MAVLAGAVLSSCSVSQDPQLLMKTQSFDLRPRDVPHIDPLPPEVWERFRREKANFHTPPPNIQFGDDGATYIETAAHHRFRLMSKDVLDTASFYPGPQPMLDETKQWADYINANPYLDNELLEKAAQNPGAPPPFAMPPPSEFHQSSFEIRDQGPLRMTCVAFAIAAAAEMHDAALPLLSEETVYHALSLQSRRTCCDNAGFDVIDAGVYLKDQRISTDANVAYRADLPMCLNSNSEACDAPAHLQDINGPPPRFKITDTSKIASGRTGPTIGNPAYLESLIAAGKNVAILIGVTWRNDAGPDGQNADHIIDVTKIDDAIPLATSFHAVVVTGYDRTNPNKPFFIIRNSYGPTWALKGLGHLSYDYIMAYAVDGLIIDEVLNADAAAADSGTGVPAAIPPPPPTPHGGGDSGDPGKGGGAPPVVEVAAPVNPPRVAHRDIVATFCAEASSVAVANDHRIFLGFPRITDDPPHAVAELIGGRHYSFPTPWLQQPGTRPLPRESFASVRALATEGNRLWILDSGSSTPKYALAGGPKLIAVDLDSCAVVKWIPLAAERLNDFRVSDSTAYVATNSGIVVVNLATGDSHLGIQDAAGIEALSITADHHSLMYKSAGANQVNIVRIADLKQESVIGTIPAAVNRIDVANNGDVFIASGNSISVETPSGSLATLETDRHSWARSVTVSPDGSLYALWESRAEPKVFALEHIVLEAPQ
jgi:hypothetical protein